MSGTAPPSAGVLGSADAALVVDLPAFDRNVAALRAAVAPADMMIVLKNDAYGHGATVLAERAGAAGVHWFGCLDLDGAVALRRDADLPADARLFAWLLLADDDFAAACAAGIDLGVGSGPVLDAVLGAATPDAPARIHLKIDTGLNRNGFRPEDWGDAVARVLEAEAQGVVRFVGVWSHISEASDADDDEARARFVAAVEAAEQAGLGSRCGIWPPVRPASRVRRSASTWCASGPSATASRRRRRTRRRPLSSSRSARSGPVSSR